MFPIAFDTEAQPGVNYPYVLEYIYRLYLND